MTELIQTLNEILKKQLHPKNYDLVEILPLPNHIDRMVRIRTVQEMIEDFDINDSAETQGFFLHIKQKKQALPEELERNSPELLTPNDIPNNIYLTDGKLNLPFLLKNAEILYDSGDYSLARNIYKSILNSGELIHTALFRIGRCFEAERKFDEARASYEESIAYLPSLEPYQYLSSLLIRQNKNTLAAEVMERTLHLKDLSLIHRFELHKSCGNCWTRAKKFSEAEKHFKKALEFMPNADEVRANLGALYLQENKIQESRRHFQDAIASNPKNYQALAGLGSCFLAENNKKKAHDYFSQSLDVELNNPNALFYLVKCAYEIKSYGVAEKLLNEYIQIAPVNTNLLYSLAGLQFHLGRIEASKSTVSRIINLQPQHSGAQELLGMIDKYSTLPSKTI